MPTLHFPFQVIWCVICVLVFRCDYLHYKKAPQYYYLRRMLGVGRPHNLSLRVDQKMPRLTRTRSAGVALWRLVRASQIGTGFARSFYGTKSRRAFGFIFCYLLSPFECGPGSSPDGEHQQRHFDSLFKNALALFHKTALTLSIDPLALPRPPSIHKTQLESFGYD